MSAVASAVAQTVGCRCCHGDEHHIVLYDILETSCSRTVELQEDNVLEHHLARTTNESQCHAFQRLWRSVSYAVVVNRPGQTWWKTVWSPKCLLQCLALELTVDTLRIFFNLQEAVSGKPRPGRFTPGKETGYLVQCAGWDPGPVWMGAENLAPTRIRSPDRPARSESL